jgi:Mobilization protein NikA
MTPRKLTPEQKIRRALRDLDLDELGADVAKSSIINLRVTEAEKDEIRTVADALGMTMAGYLLALHREVRDRLR